MTRHRRPYARTNRPQEPDDWRPPEIISAADMDAAIHAEEAIAFSHVITFIRRYRDTWWLSTPAGWFQIRPPVAEALDEHEEQMRQPAYKSAANHAAIRAVIELARKATNATVSARQ